MQRCTRVSGCGEGLLVPVAFSVLAQDIGDRQSALGGRIVTPVPDELMGASCNATANDAFVIVVGVATHGY